MNAPLSTDRQTGRDERSGADRCWIYRDGYHYAQVTFTRPDTRLYPTAVEYMRVLSRQEVDRLHNSDEGVDVIQLVNSLHRQIEGQRKHIARLEAQLKDGSRCEFGGSYGRCALERGHDGNHEVRSHG